jgi:Icc-related predicted phosphoesterase
MLRIVAMSDMHGELPVEVQKCDVVVIAGDIIPLNIQRNIKASAKWFKEAFINWANNLPCQKVILVAGNHDFWMETERWQKDYPLVPSVEYSVSDQDEKIIYLRDSGYEFNGYKFWGSPWVDGLPGWAFNTDTEVQATHFDKIPRDTDVLITHAPAYGDVGTVLQKCWNYNSNYGSIALRNVLEEGDCQIKLSFAGHIHSGLHAGEKIGNTMCYNVSIKDENYRYVYEPFYIELE